MKKPRIVEEEMTPEGRKLFGLCDRKKGKIYINPNQSPKEYLDTLVHELLHFYFPELSEQTVYRKATAMTFTLWNRGYRRKAKQR